MRILCNHRLVRSCELNSYSIVCLLQLDFMMEPNSTIETFDHKWFEMWRLFKNKFLIRRIWKKPIGKPSYWWFRLHLSMMCWKSQKCWTMCKIRWLISGGINTAGKQRLVTVSINRCNNKVKMKLLVFFFALIVSLFGLSSATICAKNEYGTQQEFADLLAMERYNFNSESRKNGKFSLVWKKKY